VLGRPSLAERPESLVEAAGALLDARPGARFLPALRRGNVLGALDMGLAPGVLPGRVSLDEGRQWFSYEWERLPEEQGLDAEGILLAASMGRIALLVLVGADPLADFPDRDLAARALDGAGAVLAVDTFLNESSRRADVVLPAAGHGETAGTTTNVEGRVSVLEQLVTAPGTARDDWIVATDLAHRLGDDLGLESIDDIQREIERISVTHAGLTPELLGQPWAEDGVLVPLRADDLARSEGTPVSIEGTLIPTGATDPTAGTPGHDTEPDGVPVEVDEAVPDDEPAGAPDDETDQSDRPAAIRFTAPAPAADLPAVDSYSLRLVALRKLYDCGTLTCHSPSLAPLALTPGIRLNPWDFDHLGVAPGGQVTVTSNRSSISVDAFADPGVPKGAAAMALNQPGPGPTELVDAAAPVTEVRVETQ
jgi:NADH-quinone oxidoreductase subunit G